jgi:hypothetical protein
LLDEISRILAWHLAAGNKQRFANAALTQPIQVPPIMTAAGIGAADRGDHSMINTDLDHLWPWP